MPAEVIPAAQARRLGVLMTQDGYLRALQLFGEQTILEFIQDHQGNLLLAAADLLDGFPAAPVTEGEGAAVSSFKLDVLEFKFEKSVSTVVDWKALAGELRARAKAMGPAGPRRANPAPVFGTWGLE